LAFPNDREAIAVALKMLRPCSVDELRLVHIKNTMELTSMMVSVGCLDSIDKDRLESIGEEDLDLEFDSRGGLISRVSNVRG